jgi:FkbM family methyltransferase
MTGYLVGGAYEVRESRAARVLFKPGDTIIELGSGLGFISACLRRGTKVGRIVTFEANPDFVAYSKRMHALNSIDAVEIRHGVAVANPSGRTMPFYVRPNVWSGSLSLNDATGPVVSTFDVPATAWSEVVSEVGPAGLVMDIEGGELDFLTTADLSPIQRMVVELHPDIYGVPGMARIYGALDRHGFALTNLSAGPVLALERA